MWWQYGSGEHSSLHRLIFEPVMLSCVTNGANLVFFCHLLVKGSLQRILARNFTRKFNRIHKNDNQSQLLSVCERNAYISMIANDTHSFVRLIRFLLLFDSSTPPISSLHGHPVSGNFKTVDDEHPFEEVISLSRPIEEVSKIE